MNASIRVRVGGDIYGNAMLCFCAAMGISRNPVGFASATMYTRILAGLHWLARLFFLEHAFEGEPRVLEEVDLAALEHFQTQFAAWMCVGHVYLYEQDHQLDGVRQGVLTNGRRPAVSAVDENKETLFHQGEGVRVQDFQKAAWTMIANADDLLHTLLGQQWGTIVSNVDMPRVSDDMIRRGVGASFATNLANRWLEAGPKKAILVASPSVDQR